MDQVGGNLDHIWADVPLQRDDDCWPVPLPPPPPQIIEPESSRRRCTVIAIRDFPDFGPRQTSSALASRRGPSPFRAIAATKDEIWLPGFRPVGYLKQSKEILAAQQGDTRMRKRVWLRNARLAYSVANRVPVRDQDMADAIQEGQLGICRAIKRFDVTRLNEFSTYAWRAIRSRIYHFHRRSSYPFIIPADLTREFWQLTSLKRRGKIPADPVAAEKVILARFPAHAKRLIRLWHRASTKVTGTTRIRRLVAPQPGADLEHQDTVRQLRNIVAALSDTDRIVIEGRFGLRGKPPRGLEDIGREIGLTKERVRQIQIAAEAKIRQACFFRDMIDEPRPAAAKPAALDSQAVRPPPARAAGVDPEPSTAPLPIIADALPSDPLHLSPPSAASDAAADDQVPFTAPTDVLPPAPDTPTNASTNLPTPSLPETLSTPTPTPSDAPCTAHAPPPASPSPFRVIVVPVLPWPPPASPRPPSSPNHEQLTLDGH